MPNTTTLQKAEKLTKQITPFASKRPYLSVVLKELKP
jgi:hypothetical protein